MGASGVLPKLICCKMQFYGVLRPFLQRSIARDEKIDNLFGINSSSQFELSCGVAHVVTRFWLTLVHISRQNQGIILENKRLIEWKKWKKNTLIQNYFWFIKCTLFGFKLIIEVRKRKSLQKRCQPSDFCYFKSSILKQTKVASIE